MLKSEEIRRQAAQRLRELFPAATGWEETAELTHTVDDNAYEKFTLTTGPRTTLEGDAPWLGVFDVELVHDGGKKLRLGPVAVISPGGSPSFYPDGGRWVIQRPEDFPGCTDRNERIVTKALKTPHVIASRELLALRRAFAASGD